MAAATQAYWVSPEGKLIEVSIHVRYILDNPGLFGKTREDLVAVYKKYKEPMGWEGKARHEIMLDAMRQGWMRIRCYNYDWTLEYFYGASTPSKVTSAVNKLVDAGHLSYKDSIRVVAMVGEGAETRVFKDDMWDTDRETGEGGVLRLLASSLAPVQVGRTVSFISQDILAGHHAYLPKTTGLLLSDGISAVAFYDGGENLLISSKTLVLAYRVLPRGLVKVYASTKVPEECLSKIRDLEAEYKL
jgi:hypothetical protein